MALSKTNVPKLKGESNYRDWLRRIHIYMEDKGTQKAVLFKKYKAEKPTNLVNVPLSKNDYLESLEFAILYEPYSDDDDWVYYPQNKTAVRHIVKHYDVGSVQSIKEIRSAREAMKTLGKLYGTTNKVQKYLIMQRL